MWNLALKTLLADRGKLLTALVGVAFSVVLVNIQGGLFLGLIAKTGLLVDLSPADIWVGHCDMHNVDFPRNIPRRWIHRIEAIEGVELVEPRLIGFSEMTLPSGGFEGVTVVGAPRDSPMAIAWNQPGVSRSAILQTDGVIIDIYEDEKLIMPEIGEVREVGGKRARIVAKTRGMMGFLVTPYLFTTYDRAASYLGSRPDEASYFLVKVAPGTDVNAVCQAIQKKLPHVEVFPSDIYSRVSANFWMTRTGLGISFGTATLLGLLVGVVMVAQTLYAMILDRLAEYGTLKAIGATDRQIYSILFSQAVILAIAGSMFGILAVALFQFLYSSPRAPILIPWWLSIGSCVLVTCICLFASVLPYLRIRRVDPLMVLQA